MITSLILELYVGDSVTIDNGRIVLILQEKSGKRSRIKFLADEHINIKKVKDYKLLTEQIKKGIK